MDFAWTDMGDGRALYAGNLPHAIAIGYERPSGRWRYDLDLPGAKHTALMPSDLAEDLILECAVLWFRSVFS